MELLETQDPEKKKLLALSDHHRKELEKEVKEISQRTERVLTNALIVGGVLALSYFAVSQFTKAKSKKKQRKEQESRAAVAAVDNENVVAEPPSLMSEIGSKILNQATMILIELAREKLMDYLEKKKDR